MSAETGGALTVAMIRDAMEKLRNAPPRYCHPHAVHPKEWERGGLAYCANCGAVVDLGEPK